MCGIAGFFHFQSNDPVDDSILRRMTDVVAHRGPDADGFFVDRPARVALGHRRLSIIDLAGGAQPMADADEDIWIVFNGEIYNFPELREELIAKGCKFQTRSDTEIIIYLYKVYGSKAFERLNGIFAFAIFDKRNQSVVLARDHFGVKPLYYWISGGKLVFGSELKSILEYPDVERSIDWAAFNTFLTFRYNPSPQTLFQGIRKLGPSQLLKVSVGGLVQEERYWNYAPRTVDAITEADAIDQYRSLLEGAVKRQMISDVPVGLFLSGGVDSAATGYLMNRASGERIKSFSIGFEGKGDYNELDDARVTAKWLGSEHYEMQISQAEYMDFFFKSFHYTEEPIAEATIPALYYLSKLAHSHLKVVLGGQGADEPLAGYYRHIGTYWTERLAPLLRLLPMQTIARLLPRNERFKRAAYVSRFTTAIDRFLAAYTIFTPEQKKLLVKPEHHNEMVDSDRQLVGRLLDQTDGLRGQLNKILFVDTRMSLSDNLLLFNDKMTMANSLEMRVPFLDTELIRFVESLPGNLKLNGLRRKYIHKKALEKWLPKEIIYRKKRGFQTPIDEWLRTDGFSRKVRDILNQSGSASRKFFCIDYVNQMIEQHASGRENYQRHLLMILSFEIWYRSFFEKEGWPASGAAEFGFEEKKSPVLT